MRCTGQAQSPEAPGHVYRSLTEHNKTLLVFQIQPKPQDPKQTVAIYIPELFPEAGERTSFPGFALNFLYARV